VNLVSPDIAWDLRTSNVDLVRCRISRLLRPFKLTADPRRTYDARLFGRQFSRTGIAIIDYGQEVDVEADPMQSFSLIQIPIRGSFELHGAGKSAVVKSNEAHLMGPVTPLRMHWSPDCRLLVLRLDDWTTRRLVAKCRLTVPAIWSERDLGVVLPIDKGPGLSLFRIVCLLRDEALTNGSISNQHRFVSSIEDLLVRLLTHSLEAGTQSAADTGVPSSACGLVERAKAFMLANLTHQISTADVAKACRVSTRTLFSGFQRTLHKGPKTWLIEKRLDKVHETLCQEPATAGTVTEIALMWGFNHLGRFSNSYRRRFGESPSQTMRRHACR
jgi:AraC-like DNA-binding protein